MLLKKSFFTTLWTANPKIRRNILISLDIFIITLFFFLIKFLFYKDSFFVSRYLSFWTYFKTIALALPLYILTKQYKTLSRYSEAITFYQILFRNVILFILVYFIDFTFKFFYPGQSILVLLILCISLSQIFLRLTIRDFVNYSRNLTNKKKLNIAIYGAGQNGVQLFKNLRQLNKYKVICFIDDNPILWGRSILGVQIKSPQYLEYIKDDLDQLLLAISGITNKEKKSKIEFLKNFSIRLLTIPSTEQLMSGQAKLNNLKPISIYDLLGRDSVTADKNLLKQSVGNKSVLITGAGGSIGSELCNQIINLNPKILIIFDMNESSLYEINNKLVNLKPRFEVIPVLGNACNSKLLEKTFLDHQVEVVFHAAAYKHVPLVEINPLEAISNNIISTLNICLAAESSRVKNIVFISSDKAVRPTNTMGASKRLSELIIQAFSQRNSSLIKKESSPQLIFSMVRFGNVLDSSGSVVPLFKKQISEGGPLTLTHENIIRYFMTIPEASQLVLQSLPLARGGDLFLLDMGEPISIKKIAEQMICLSGQTIKNKENPNGDVEIVITGLRPGEKLYEELLIDSESLPTSHPLIFKAREKSINEKVLFEKLDLLLDSLKEYNKEKSLELLNELVPEWKRSDFCT